MPQSIFDWAEANESEQAQTNQVYLIMKTP